MALDEPAISLHRSLHKLTTNSALLASSHLPSADIYSPTDVHLTLQGTLQRDGLTHLALHNVGYGDTKSFTL